MPKARKRTIYLTAGTIKRIHINKQIIQKNLKNCPWPSPCTCESAITIQTSRSGVHRADSVDINGPSRVIYSPHTPLSCGARCWIETKAEVSYVEDVT